MPEGNEPMMCTDSSRNPTKRTAVSTETHRIRSSYKSILCKNDKERNERKKMGNTQPTNNTGRKVVIQKLENAKKTGVLSLSEHNLEACPNQVFEILNLRTLDLSSNSLRTLNPNIINLQKLKILNLEGNKLMAGTLNSIQRLSNLQNLNVGSNSLGETAAAAAVPTKTKTSSKTSVSTSASKPKNAPASLPPTLPKGLKQIKLSSNSLSIMPRAIFTLAKLDKLDLSMNQIIEIPEEIANLSSTLTELNLDFNLLTRLPNGIGSLTKLKTLSLKGNSIAADKRSQPLPASLFANTPVIDLNLHGNPMTSSQLNDMDGFDEYLKRRQRIKTSTLLGGALTNLDVCGLD